MSVATPSITSALNDSPIRRFHLRTAAITSVGFFTDAYDLFVIGTALALLKGPWHLSASNIAKASAISLLGTAIGALVLGYLSDRYGRKKLYGLESLIMVIGALASFLANGIEPLLIARFILGIGIGGDYPVSAVLMAEYANTKNRGRLVSGVFSAQALGLIVGPSIALLLLTTHLSHVMDAKILLGAGAVPAACVLYFRRKMPESPRFTAKVLGKNELAIEEINSFSDGSIVALPSSGQRQKIGILKFLSNPHYLKLLLATAGSWFFLDYAYYGNTISTPLVLGKLSPNGSIFSHTLTNLLVFVVVAVPGYIMSTLFLDRIGHRRLQLVGFFAMAVIFTSLGAVSASLANADVFLLLFAASYFFIEFGPNVTTFVIPSEVFPVGARGSGHGISSSVAKIGAFIGVYAFPVISHDLGIKGAILFSGIAAIAGLGLTLILPEPARRSLEEVSNEDDVASLLAESAYALALERDERRRAELLAEAAGEFSKRLEEDTLISIFANHAKAAIGATYSLSLHLEARSGAILNASGNTEILKRSVVEKSIDQLGLVSFSLIRTPQYLRREEFTQALSEILNNDILGAFIVSIRTNHRTYAITICADRFVRRNTHREVDSLSALQSQAESALENAALHRKVSEAESRYRTLVEQIPAVLYIETTDVEPKMTYVSPQIERLTRIPASDFLTQNSLRTAITHEDDREILRKARGGLIDGAIDYSIEYRIVDSSGHEKWVRDDAVAIKSSEDEVLAIQGILSDVTERKIAEAQVTNLAFSDPLTGLANRRSFIEATVRAIEEAARNKTSFIVLFLDLNKFKAINDGYGHKAGDELLVEVAKRLHGGIRQGDIVARQGGDEFLILLRDIKTDGSADDRDKVALAAINRIRDNFKEPFELSESTVTMTSSIGASIYPYDGMNPSELIESADSSMYRDKQTGNPKINKGFKAVSSNARNTLFLASRLRSAHKNDEYELLYQPIVNLLTEETVAAEALIRLKEADGSLLSPAEWLSIAEDIGVMEDLVSWTLERVCQDQMSWKSSGINTCVSVNLSPRQIRSGESMKRLKSDLEVLSLLPSMLSFEITESSLLDHDPCVLQTIDELRDKGFTFAIDDFGTGYSSLYRLKSLPFDAIKIDRSFISDIDDEKGRRLISAIISIAHGLEIDAVAEGIERVEQQKALIDLGCNLGQGYLFGRPSSAMEFASNFKNIAMNKRLEIGISK
ncbi:MAG: MFS transporter [Actinomycetota bacterium]|nr:MFS transporter [Actinomycetota bacterium]